MKSKIFYLAMALGALGAEANRGGGIGIGKKAKGGSCGMTIAGHGASGVQEGHGTNGILGDGGTTGRTSRGGTQG